MATERFALRHFYYGQFVRDGNPAGDLRLLAQTNGLSNSSVAEALQLALIPPMAGKDEGSWAVIRGKKELPFILVESEVGSAGQTMLHYVVLPSEVMRAIGGNLRQLMPLIAGKMPEYDKVGNILKPLVLLEVQPPDEAQEIDDILELMMFTKNRLDVMERLLSAIVRGVPVWIRNAPENPEDRLFFISGLLMLLPPSVRFAVTFATHTRASTDIDVQLRFVAGDDPEPDNVLVFDWKTGKANGVEVEDAYSRYIVSQLRLDAEGVVQRTRLLTEVASYRVKQGDRLAEALEYASNRLSVDDAVLNNQPIESVEVSKILANDPTLSDDMRLAYSQHLINFSLAVGDLKHVEPIGFILGRNVELAATTYDLLKNALHEGEAGEIFDLMVRWLENPAGPQGQRWIDLTHECAITYFTDVVDDADVPEIIDFLKDVDRVSGIIVAEQIIPQLIEIVLPIASIDKELTMITFMLAIHHAPIQLLHQLLMNPTFLEHLPDAMSNFMRVLRTKGVGKPGLIVSTAAKFESEQRVILVRLVELALMQKQYLLIDPPVMRQLIRVGITDWGRQKYGDVLGNVVAVFNVEKRLLELEGDMLWLPQAILLALGAYDHLVKRLLEHSALLYTGDRQPEFARMILRIFSETPIPDDEIANALDELGERGIRSLPLVLAHIGTLESHKPSEITDAVSGDVSDMLVADMNLVDVMPADAMLPLVRYQMGRKDAAHLMISTRFFPLVAARYGERTVKMMVQVYQRLNWSSDVKRIGMEMLRLYVRHVDLDVALAVLDKLGQFLEKDVMEKLEATYAIKSLMDNNDISSYAKMLHNLAGFLQDTAQAYHGRSSPSQGAILNDMDSMPGGLTNQDKQQMADELVKIGLSICELGKNHTKQRGNDSEKRIEALLNAQEDPRSTLEIMRVMAGYLTDGKLHQVKLIEQQHPHPLPRRTATSFHEELAFAHYLLRGMVYALPENQGSINARAIYDEMDSIWRSIPREQQRELQQPLARDLQRIAELIPAIASDGDIRALEDTGLGRRLENNKVTPRNPLELYRFIAGYYIARS